MRVLLGGCAQDLKPEQAVALVACLVWREKSDAAPRVSEDMEGPVAALREAARRVAKASPILTIIYAHAVVDSLAWSILPSVSQGLSDLHRLTLKVFAESVERHTWVSKALWLTLAKFLAPLPLLS